MSASQQLTERQQEVLDLLHSLLMCNKTTPTIRELQKELGFKSTRAVIGHLIALERKGYIQRDSTARGIRLLKHRRRDSTKREVTYLPLLGNISAGKPVLAKENIEEWIPVPTNMVRSKRSFLLRVKGDSMINAHILNGDLIVVCPDQTIQQGDIVVALIGDDATVKRMFRNKNGLELRPENEKYKSLFIADEIVIQGKVVSAIRTGIAQ